MLYVGLLSCGWLSGSAHLVAQNPLAPPHPEVVDKIRSALAPWKAEVSVDPSLPQQAPVLVLLDTANDAALKKLAQYPAIGAVQIIDARRCTAGGYSALKSLPHLYKLSLEHSSLTPAGLTAIAQCAQLRSLVLMDAGLTDATLASLKSLRYLEHLNLNNNPKITDEGLKTLASLERLRSLHLAHTSITNKGLETLKSLEGLRTLNVVQTAVSQKALEQLAEAMPNLRNIRR
jgi:hypothetical protein